MMKENKILVLITSRLNNLNNGIKNIEDQIKQTSRLKNSTYPNIKTTKNDPNNVQLIKDLQISLQNKLNS